MKLLWAVFEFIFGCRHRHLSRVFTIKHRTYCVCFDCGREFELPDAIGSAPPDDSHTTRWPTDPPAKSSSCRLKPSRFRDDIQSKIAVL